MTTQPLDPSAGERRFRILAEAMPLCVWTARPSGNVEWYNERWFEYTGQPQSEQLPSWTTAAHPQDYPRIMHAWNASIEQERRLDIEVRLRRHDGRFRWFLIRIEPVKDESGRLTQWIGTATDIEDARRTSDAMRFLAESGAKLGASLDLKSTLRAVARLGVERGFADISFFDILDGDSLQRVACEYRDPARASDTALLATFAPPLSGKKTNVVRALLSRKPSWMAHVPEDWFREVALNDEHLALLQRLQFRSLIAVPAIVRDEVLGVLSFARSDPESPFDQRDVDVAEELARRAAIAIKNATLYEREHRIASTLQYAFLPGFLPVVEGCAFDSVYRPATAETQLGGDWYDAFVLADGRVALSVGDVTGHGLEAATMMVRVRETLRASTFAIPDRPELVLERTNRALLAGAQGALVTAIVGVLDIARGRFIYACAGHPPPAFRRQGLVRFLRGGGIPLGADIEPTFTVSEVKLEADDVLLLYTDGLIEATRDVLEGERRLQAAMLRDLVTANSIVDEVAGNARSDDVAVLLVHLTGTKSGTSSRTATRGWEFSSDDSASAETARASFTSYLRGRGVPDSNMLACEIAFGELVGNVVRHAPGRIDIELEWRPPHPVLRVRDYGQGFDLQETSLPKDMLSEGGRGLYLIEALGTKLQFVRMTQGGMTVVAELPVEVTL